MRKPVTLITGANGEIGHGLLDYFNEQGDNDVVAIDLHPIDKRLRETCYDSANDLLVIGGTLPPDAKGLRRTPVYDCATNRWVALAIGGAVNPNDPRKRGSGRNVSLGLMYDAKRGLVWAVDTDSRVYVLRIDIEAANALPPA